VVVVVPVVERTGAAEEVRVLLAVDGGDGRALGGVEHRRPVARIAPDLGLAFRENRDVVRGFGHNVITPSWFEDCVARRGQPRVYRSSGSCPSPMRSADRKSSPPNVSPRS